MKCFSNTSSVLVIFISMLFLGGCMTSQPQPTPEQIAMQQKLFQKLMGAQQQLNQQNMEQTKTAPVPEPIRISESELLEKIQVIPSPNQNLLIVKKKDGFDINGLRYVDPEGQIVSYGYDVISGDITYLAKTGYESFVIKYMKALSNQEPITIASAERQEAQWSVETITGKKLNGQSLTPLPKGFMVSRENSGFIYEPGAAISSFGTPDGFHLAGFQNGEVQKTNLALLERDSIDVNDKIGSLFDNVKSLGSSLGINKKEDYILFNYKTGKAFPLNIDSNGKLLALHSNCRKKNNFVNECSQVDFYESLFDKYGMPNGSHYFWRVFWFATESGPIAIANEGTSVYVYGIDNESKSLAFKRVLGVNYIESERSHDGKIFLKAKLGLDSEQIDDIEKFVLTSNVATN